MWKYVDHTQAKSQSVFSLDAPLGTRYIKVAGHTMDEAAKEIVKEYFPEFIVLKHGRGKYETLHKCFVNKLTKGQEI